MLLDLVSEGFLNVLENDEVSEAMAGPCFRPQEIGLTKGQTLGLIVLDVIFG